MADRRFLEFIDQFRQCYRPTPMEITETYLNRIEESLKFLGQKAMCDEYTPLIVLTHLASIFNLCLHALKAKDYDALFEGIIDLHSRKNAGYAGIGATDPWANFRTGRWFGVSDFQGCLVRMGDKYIRVKNLHLNPASDQVNESIKDTLHDLAVYCVIAMCIYEERQSIGAFVVHGNRLKAEGKIEA